MHSQTVISFFVLAVISGAYGSWWTETRDRVTSKLTDYAVDKATGSIIGAVEKHTGRRSADDDLPDEVWDALEEVCGVDFNDDVEPPAYAIFAFAEVDANSDGELDDAEMAEFAEIVEDLDMCNTIQKEQ